MFITGVTTGHFIFPSLYYVNKQLLREPVTRITQANQNHGIKKKKKISALGLNINYLSSPDIYISILISKSGEIKDQGLRTKEE